MINTQQSSIVLQLPAERLQGPFGWQSCRVVRDKSRELDGSEATRANRWEMETLSGLMELRYSCRWHSVACCPHAAKAGLGCRLYILHSALQHGGLMLSMVT